ncbi:DUF1801 domain-containing protein [Euzebyella saccharophila]|uniref:DUF1801 domain-containing protein n=1 Tax=Euzebyella saccharophila TaxID=679664 RepID=A0ABV8JJQ5_9FLAO|nr:DUF1801 domain-containing protein [Euzebyella saccharophila]
MDRQEKMFKYYEEEHQFRTAIGVLRDLALKTGLEETYKWNFPTYTINGKNVLAICKFKQHFGIWFFNGAVLSDFDQVLENAQVGKTQAMRHWKFKSQEDVDPKKVTSYMLEAIDNQRKGIEHKTSKKSTSGKVDIPELLNKALTETDGAQNAFEGLSNYKKRNTSNISLRQNGTVPSCPV